MKHTDPRYFDPIDTEEGDGSDRHVRRRLIITPNDEFIRLKTARHSFIPGDSREVLIDLTPEQLRDAINRIPGFNVRYDRPAPAVPQGLGAVIRSPKGYYIRTAAPANLNPWRNTITGTYYSDEYLVERLIEGAEVLSEGVML